MCHHQPSLLSSPSVPTTHVRVSYDSYSGRSSVVSPKRGIRPSLVSKDEALLPESVNPINENDASYHKYQRKKYKDTQ